MNMTFWLYLFNHIIISIDYRVYAVNSVIEFFTVDLWYNIILVLIYRCVGDLEFDLSVSKIH